MNLNVILLIVGIIFALLVVIGASKLIFRCGRKIVAIIIVPFLLIYNLINFLKNKLKYKK